MQLIPDSYEVYSPELRRASPTNVLSASTDLKIGVALLLPVSFWGSVSMIIYPPKGLPSAIDFGVLCAGICCYVVFIFCWSAICAYLIRKLNASPTRCSLAGLPFLIVGVAVLIPEFYRGPSHRASLATLAISATMFAGSECRRLAYPAITPRQLYKLDPRPPGVF